MASVSAYRDLIQKLLPIGRAWTRDYDTFNRKLTEGLAAEFSRVDDRAKNLLRELNPLHASESVSDFEDEYGLPDVCGGLSNNPAKRLDNLISRIRGEGGQSFQFFLDTLAQAGILITISMQAPFRAGGLAGSEVKSDAYNYIWFVTIPDADIIYFRTGVGRTGDPLTTSTTSSDVVCFLERNKPAHTVIVYTFE